MWIEPLQPRASAIGRIAACVTTVMLAFVVPGAAAAKTSGLNGRIVFSTVVGDDNTLTYTVDPDGSDLELVYPGFSGFPRWSPDGSHIMIQTGCVDGQENCAATIVDVVTGSFVQFKDPEFPNFFYSCTAWSPDSLRLACDGWSDDDPSRNGTYTIRASDGGDLTRMTSNPFGGHDGPGDYSPDGTEFVFARNDPTRPKHAGTEQGQRGNAALFVVNVDGSGVHRITPWGLVWSEDAGRWSPDGTEILFDNNGSLFEVHPDGSSLRRIGLKTGANTFIQNPDWSPDGTKIVFSLATITGPGSFQTGIYTADADGTDLERVTTPESFDRYADWGPA